MPAGSKMGRDKNSIHLLFPAPPTNLDWHCGEASPKDHTRAESGNSLLHCLRALTHVTLVHTLGGHVTEVLAKTGQLTIFGQKQF